MKNKFFGIFITALFFTLPICAAEISQTVPVSNYSYVQNSAYKFADGIVYTVKKSSVTGKQIRLYSPLGKKNKAVVLYAGIPERSSTTSRFFEAARREGSLIEESVAGDSIFFGKKYVFKNIGYSARTFDNDSSILKIQESLFDDYDSLPECPADLCVKYDKNNFFNNKYDDHSKTDNLTVEKYSEYYFNLQGIIGSIKADIVRRYMYSQDNKPHKYLYDLVLDKSGKVVDYKMADVNAESDKARVSIDKILKSYRANERLLTPIADDYVLLSVEFKKDFDSKTRYESVMVSNDYAKYVVNKINSVWAPNSLKKDEIDVNITLDENGNFIGINVPYDVRNTSDEVIIKNAINKALPFKKVEYAYYNATGNALIKTVFSNRNVRIYRSKY